MQEPPITLQQYRDWCRENGIISRDCYPIEQPVYDYSGFTLDELQAVQAEATADAALAQAEADLAAAQAAYDAAAATLTQAKADTDAALATVQATHDTYRP